MAAGASERLAIAERTQRHVLALMPADEPAAITANFVASRLVERLNSHHLSASVTHAGVPPRHRYRVVMRKVQRQRSRLAGVTRNG
jgi:hypothetical protein